MNPNVLNYAVQNRDFLFLYCLLHYAMAMSKEHVLQIRLTAEEKQGFQLPAEVAGIPLSSWVRERLRLAAIRDLEGAGIRVPFIKPVSLGGKDGP